MTESFASNETAASELALSVKEKLDGYLEFSLRNIEGVAPVLGSPDHDGLSNTIKSALFSWSELITSDATAIESTASDFDSLDSSLAGELLGVRSGSE